MAERRSQPIQSFNPDIPIIQDEGLGGYLIVADKNERDQITLDRRKLKILIALTDTGTDILTLYVGTDLADVNWTNDANWKLIIDEDSPIIQNLLQLGELSTTAYRGDRGKIAYDYSQAAHAPVDAEKNVNADFNATSGDAEILNKPLPYSESSGILWGCAISINISDPTKFDIAPGAIVIVDSFTNPETTVKTIVQLPTGLTSQTDPYLATADTVYIAIGVDGNLNFNPDIIFSNADRRNLAVIGWVDHVNRTEIEFTALEPCITYSVESQFQDFLAAFGAFNILGSEYTYATGLQIRRSAGQAFCPNLNFESDTRDPHVITNNSENPCPIYYYYRSIGGWVNNTPVSNYIDPEYYDDGSGTLAVVPSGKFQIQVISFYPFWEATDIQYGQRVYDTLAEAQSALKDSVEINPYNDVDVFRGWLVVQQGCTDLSNAAQAIFVSSGKWGMFDVQSGGGTGGEVNTASNIGDAGEGLFRSKIGVDLQFKNLKASSRISIIDNLGDKTLDFDFMEDATHRLVTDAQIASWNSSSGITEAQVYAIAMSVSMGGF